MNMPTMTPGELVTELTQLRPSVLTLTQGATAELLLTRRRIHAFANYLWYTATDQASRELAMTIVVLFVGPTNEDMRYASTH